MNKWLKHSLAAVLTLTMVINPTAMVLAKEGIPGSPWRDTCIIGNLPGTVPELKDDFYTAVNYQWQAAHTEVPAGYRKYGVREEQAEQNKSNLIAVLERNTPGSHEEALVDTLYQKSLDMEARNKAGINPILPYINEIRNIKSLEEMTAFLCNGVFHLDNRLISSEDMSDLTNPEKNMVVYSLSLGKGISHDGFYDDFMKKAKIPEREAAAYIDGAKKINQEIDSVEKGEPQDTTHAYQEYASLCNPVTNGELKERFTSYPLEQMLVSMGMHSDATTLSFPDLNKFDKLDELYREDNLEGLKGILIMSVFDASFQWLDEDGLKYYDTLNGKASDDKKDRAYQICNTYLTEPLMKIYTDYFMTEEIIADVSNMVEDIRHTFIERIGNMTWMSEQTRKEAQDKVASIRARVAKGEKWRDYSGLDLSGLSADAVLGDYVIETLKYTTAMNTMELSLPVDIGYWIRGAASSAEVGAYYNPLDNSINIPPGIIGGVFYRPNSSIEERYFSIGTVIGHELTHSLDTDGSQFDKTGAMNDWWPAADRAAFDARQKRVEAYFSTIMVVPDQYVNGVSTIGENAADMGGISLLLSVMKEKEKTQTIDYGKAFLAYASLWPEVESEEYAVKLLENDVHSPKYIRVNGMFQQFEKFYEVFDVKEGDGMYLAPERRVGIWNE